MGDIKLSRKLKFVLAVGVLRLSDWFASLASHSAQDDKLV
jgi:hypothetical protein